MAGIDANELSSEAISQSQMVRSGKTGRGHKKACILKTITAIELKLSQNLPEGVSYDYLQGCQGHNDLTMGADDDAASQKWENNNNDNNDFYKASYPGSTISKMLYIYKKPGI